MCCQATILGCEVGGSGDDKVYPDRGFANIIARPNSVVLENPGTLYPKRAHDNLTSSLRR
jgi:hypothetical protein